MANIEHLEILSRGVDAWNQWRIDNPKVKPDLSDANLSYKDLWCANLSHADLNGALGIDNLILNKEIENDNME